MSRVLSLLAAFTLALACLPAAAEQPVTPVTALGGTSWRSPEGVEFHFTGNAKLFFSFDPEQPMYHFIGDGLYLTTPPAPVGGPYVVLDSARVCEFTFNGHTLLLRDRYDTDSQQVFSRIDPLADLVGTWWQGENGDLYEINIYRDDSLFACWISGHILSRTEDSLGAYYPVTVDKDGVKHYDTDAPFALLPDGDTLRVYGTKDGTPYLWQTFTRITD